MTMVAVVCSFFFFNDTATTEIYTLSLHDALPISAETDRAPRAPGGYERVGEREVRRILGVERRVRGPKVPRGVLELGRCGEPGQVGHPVGERPVGERRVEGMPRLRGDVHGDRKSTRLNSSHLVISYAV